MSQWFSNSREFKVATTLMEESQEESATTVYHVETTDLEACKQKLMQSVTEIGINLLQQDRNKLYSLLCEYQSTFVPARGRRGRNYIILVQMKMDTGVVMPKHQPVRCTPFAAKEEIATQIKQRLDQIVIYPSDSPWVSPVVLVKKDGSLHFCTDYSSLNSCNQS